MSHLTPGTSHITPAEREVLILVKRGMRNQQIAARLGVSLSTVKSHVTSLYRKTGVRTRVELARECDRYLRDEIREIERLLDPQNAAED